MLISLIQIAPLIMNSGFRKREEAKGEGDQETLRKWLKWPRNLKEKDNIGTVFWRATQIFNHPITIVTRPRFYIRKVIQLLTRIGDFNEERWLMKVICWTASKHIMLGVVILSAEFVPPCHFVVESTPFLCHSLYWDWLLSGYWIIVLARIKWRGKKKKISKS